MPLLPQHVSLSPVDDHAGCIVHALGSTVAGLFVTGGKPYLRASVGYQINLWDFFEEVG
ncbi:MAG: hypothetical protein PPHEMADM_0546 [uncultured Paraburkholderia sp.]|nr:MAG: hypothetical protein PPHEMADM_0546 [uncultured Paraburkholderia sp.]